MSDSPAYKPLDQVQGSDVQSTALDLDKHIIEIIQQMYSGRIADEDLLPVVRNAQDCIARLSIEMRASLRAEDLEYIVCSAYNALYNPALVAAVNSEQVDAQGQSSVAMQEVSANEHATVGSNTTYTKAHELTKGEVQIRDLYKHFLTLANETVELSDVQDKINKAMIGVDMVSSERPALQSMLVQVNDMRRQGESSIQAADVVKMLRTSYDGVALDEAVASNAAEVVENVPEQLDVTASAEPATAKVSVDGMAEIKQRLSAQGERMIPLEEIDQMLAAALTAVAPTSTEESVLQKARKTIETYQQSQDGMPAITSIQGSSILAMLQQPTEGAA